jgi:gliding motility-associated-like protein
MNGFSPDGDGQNDTFTILGVQNYPDNSLLIFNKWGEQVFEQTNYKNDWNGGKTEGENLSSEDSVYYYVFKDGKGKSYSGYLQILAQN